MLEKNSLPFGLVLTLLVSAAGFGVLFGTYYFFEAQGWVSDSGFRPMFRERTCGIFAIFLGVFLLNFFQKRHLYNSVRGVVLAVGLMLIAWIVAFGKHIF